MSIKVPMGVVKGVFVPLDNLYYLVDFIEFNIESKKKKMNIVPIILGRPCQLQ